MSIKVKIDNVEVEFDAQEQQPLLHQGRTYVPVRALFEHMGYAVYWFPGTGSNPKGIVHMWNGEKSIVIFEDSSFFRVGATEYSHTDNLKAMIVGGRMMMPLRGVLQQIGCSVNWDADTETVIVSTNTQAEVVVEGYYKIRNTEGKYLTYISPVKNGDEITVENDNGSDTQIWKIEAAPDANKYHIKPAQRNSHAMNVYQSSYYPCTIYTTANNVADTSFSLVSTQGNNYVIKWESEAESRYLDYNGSNSYWNQTNSLQTWTLISTTYTPSLVEYKKEYPVAGYTGTGITYTGHSSNARDFQVPAGTAIYATMSGTVIDVVMNFNNDYNYDPETDKATGGATSSIEGTMESYGNYIKLQVDIDGTILIYAHQQQSNYVQENDRVFAGQQIGEVGNTGCSTGDHMHFEADPINTPGNSVYDYFLFD